MNRCGVAFQTKKEIRRMRWNEEFRLKFRKKKLNPSLKYVLIPAVDRETCSAMHYQPKQPKTLPVLNQGGARENWGRSLVSSSTGSWYSSKHTDWLQAPKLVTGTQTGHRHPSFRTKHDKTWSWSPRRLIPPDIGTHSWSSLWRLIQLPILSLKILGPSLLTDNSEIWEGGFLDSNRSRWYCT